MRALVVYATNEGHTRKIAEWIGKWLRERNVQALVCGCEFLSEGFNLKEFDAAFVLGSIRIGKHQPQLARFVSENSRDLSTMPSAFISASATGSKTDTVNLAKAQVCIDAFLAETGWAPCVTTSIGGAILYTKYNMITRWVMKRICAKEGGPTDTSKDHELTDWNRLGEFLDRFNAEYMAPRAEWVGVASG